MYRIDRLERGGSKNNLVLYHFVTCLGSSSSESAVIFTRLLKKVLCIHVGLYTYIVYPYNSTIFLQYVCTT